ncbi:MAG: M20/M25/M40 family metallo-hydrolase, partial [Phycisphaeraceae bacterium]|nr:M20/M25/M40 family metallo-hydrolase [Phycisphaeraceae bacterium]
RYGWSPAAHFTRKARAAARHGAAALLIVTPPSHASGGPAGLRAGLRSPVDMPVLYLSTDALVAALDAAGRDGEAALRAWQRRADRGEQVPEAMGLGAAVDVALRRPKVTAHNIAAKWPGRGVLADQVVVLGAHYDHLGFGGWGSRVESTDILHPGADDNASGTAAVALAAFRLGDRLAGIDSHRTVLVVFFSAEERGLIGSTAMIKHWGQTGLKLPSVTAMVNLDMVGRVRDQRIWALAAESSPRWPALLRRAGEAAGLKVRTESENLPTGGSDHMVFLARGIPAVTLFSGLHDDYHTPADTMAKINVTGGARVTLAALNVVTRLATIDKPIPMAEDFRLRAPRRRQVRLGIMPDYTGSDSQPGVGVQSVIVNTPAAEAGLKVGDRIVNLGGRPINDLNDLTAALAEGKPGEAVVIEIIRDGRRHALEVTLRRR